MNPIFFIHKDDGVHLELLQGSCDPSRLLYDGVPMEELTANTTDGAHEKHVPAVEVDGQKVTVKVGSVTHPMLPEHYIQWIYLQTKRGCQRVMLTPGEEPAAVFFLAKDDEALAAYEYCNLHGLWKVSV